MTIDNDEISPPLSAQPSAPANTEPRDWQLRALRYKSLVGLQQCLPWERIVAHARTIQATDIIFNHARCLMRRAGQLEPAPDELQVDVETCEKGLISILPNDRAFDQLLGADGAGDFAVTLDGQRFRGNVYIELDGINASFRPISNQAFTPEQLMIEPKAIEVILNTKQGLVLVAGPTGSGKSATVATLLEEINKTYNYNVITIEDPIEYIFTPKKCVFSQREVGQHVEAFDTALRSAMRQNPDVIFVGEIRDYPTMWAALKAAETGHLVFSTIHTRRVYTTLNRMVNMAPSSERDQVRDALAQTLLLLMCQRLLHGAKGEVVPCREIIIRNNALIGVINSGKMRDLNNVMLSNRQNGMVDWNNALNNLVTKHLITSKEAEMYRDKEDTF